MVPENVCDLLWVVFVVLAPRPTPLLKICCHVFSGPEESAFIWSGVELFISSFSRDGRAIAQAEEGISQTIFKFVND